VLRPIGRRGLFPPGGKDRNLSAAALCR